MAKPVAGRGKITLPGDSASWKEAGCACVPSVAGRWSGLSLLPLVCGPAAAQARRVLPGAPARRGPGAASLALPHGRSARSLQRLERRGRRRGGGVARRGRGRSAGRVPRGSRPASANARPSAGALAALLTAAAHPALGLRRPVQRLQLVEAAARALGDAGQRRLDQLHRQARPRCAAARRSRAGASRRRRARSRARPGRPPVPAASARACP